MEELTQKEQQARSRVCLALDVPSVEDGLIMAAELSDYVGTFKINSLHTEAESERVDIVREILNRGGLTFLDLKFHDTPTSVYNYGVAAAVQGVYVFNIHIAGGEEMCKKAIEGAQRGAEQRGIKRPKVIGVTELTSLDDGDLAVQGLRIKYNDLVLRRTELAQKWGLDGIVCAANKAGYLESRFGPKFTYVTPGIKWAGKQGAGQKQLYTPDKAVRDCSNSILVIGSAITKAGNIYKWEGPDKKLVKRGTSEDRRATAYEILQAMAKEL